MSDKLVELFQSIPDNVRLMDALEELSMSDPAVFCALKRRLRGKPLSFRNDDDISDIAIDLLRTQNPQNWEHELRGRLLMHRPWMLEPLRDRHPHKAYEKARQVGISELSLTEAIHFLTSAKPGEKLKWVYTFPRDSQLRDFSNTRIAEALRETKAMRDLVTGSNQIYAKGLRNGHLLLRSAWESGLGEGIDADGVTLDEKDRMKDGVDIAFRESLASSKYGWLREVSTPSLPDRGVDKSFRASDQRTWFVACKNGHKQEITFEDNIHQVKGGDLLGVKELPPGTYDYLCRYSKCRAPLERRNGEWVTKYPDRVGIRGYHLSQLMAVWITATQLMQKKLEYRFYQPWANYCLGITAKGDNMMLSSEDFLGLDAQYQRITRRSPVWTRIGVGIDWGHQNWVTVFGDNTNGRRYLLDIGIFEDDYRNPLSSVRAIEQYLIPFQPDVIVADAGYGKDRNAYLIKKFTEGRDTPADVYACWYNPSTKASRTFQPVWGENRVLVDRTMTLKVVARTIKDREWGMPTMADPRVALLVKHWTSLSTMLHEEENVDTGTKSMVEEIAAVGGEDHLAHATCYGLLGLDRVAKTTNTFSFDFV